MWSKATVNIDYHIQFDDSFYSVPYQLTRQSVEVRATPTTIEIFHQGKRVASHLRQRKPYTAVTNSEHRLASHRAHLDWPPSRMIQWARTVGPHTAEMVEKILASFPHPEMGYRSCLGIIRLGQRYPATRMQARKMFPLAEMGMGIAWSANHAPGLRSQLRMAECSLALHQKLKVRLAAQD